MGEEKRPSPEQLLAQIKAEDEKIQKKEYGKLKIFLGYAAGSGKTYAMLSAAQELRRQKVDVVAGYVEPHARPETSALMEGLEAIPFQMVEYKGIKVREFDLNKALERRPKVLLVDELAHTNAKGCRHAKRYQDIEELLKRGIHVYTTVNIQHLESLNDIVENITKIKVKERIPDRIFDEADQVKLVDIEPEELIDRMKEGKIYQKIQAERALQNFFTRDKLVALREIALRRMADRVNHLAEKEKQALGSSEYSTGEHILTCISPSPTNAKVIRAAARLAYAFHGEFTALYVETRDIQNADDKVKKMRDANIRLARTLGAKVATVFGDNVAWQIAEYAKVSNISKIVMGRTNHKIFFGQTKGTLVEELTQYAPNLDVYIIPDFRSENRQRRWKPPKRKSAFTWKDAGKTLGILGISTLAGFFMKEMGISEPNIIMGYLIGVMCISIYTHGYIGSMIASVLSVVLFNYFFTIPIHSLQAYDKSYPVTFAMMFTVAFLMSSIMSKARRQNEETAKKAYRTEILLSNSRKLRRCQSQERVAEEVAKQIQKLKNFTVVFYSRKEGKIQKPLVFFREGLSKENLNELKMAYTSDAEKAVAGWVFGNGHRAGCCTHTLPDSHAIYLPVMDGDEVLAVVGLVLEEKREIPVFEYDIIIAILNETALVMERLKRIADLKRQVDKSSDNLETGKQKRK